LRFFFVLVLILVAGLGHAPTGVPFFVFSDANLTIVPPHLLSAARFERMDVHAVRLAVTNYVQPRGPGMPQPETVLTHLRGRVLSGKDQMAVFALERGYVGHGIYGWEDAASRCFSKPAEELTLSDAATLLLHMRSPSTVWDSRIGELLDRRNELLKGMVENGYITDEDARTATMRPLVYCGN
jgi:hypothetical protein